MKATAEPEGAAPKRAPGSLAELFHDWRYLFWFLGLILVIVLFYFEENWRGEREWRNYRMAMAARGEAVNASAFVPQPASSEENFTTAPGIPQIFMGQPISPRYDAAASALKARPEIRSNSWVSARTDLTAWQAAFLTNAPKTAQAGTNAIATSVMRQAAAVAVLAALSDAKSALEKIRAASARPRSRFNIAYEQDDRPAIILRHLAPLKHLSQILKLRASAELALGEIDEAASDVNLMLFLADACRDEPILISQLVRIAQLQLALQPLAEGMDQWSELQLRGFEDRLGRFDFYADGRRTLEAERVFFGWGVIDYIRRSSDKAHLFSAMSSGGSSGSVELAGALLTVAPKGWLDLEEVNFSQTFADCLLPAIDVPGRQISPRACRRGGERVSALLTHSAGGLFFRHRTFSALLLPSLPNSVRKMAFGQAAAEEAAVACALQRYRLTNGQFPESLSSLSPEFVAKLPHDVVNGQPLSYRRSDTSHYVLYSVGWNEADDEGIVGTTKNHEGADLETGDWVWRPN